MVYLNWRILTIKKENVNKVFRKVRHAGGFFALLSELYNSSFRFTVTKRSTALSGYAIVV